MEMQREPNQVGCMTNGLPKRLFIILSCTALLAQPAKIESGASFSLFLHPEDGLFVWGQNTSGQFGNGTTRNSSTPLEIGLAELLAGETIIAISGGINHTLALTDSGRIYAWGDNSFGQLGIGNDTSHTSPVLVDMTGSLSGKEVITIVAGNRHSLALTTAGEVYSWGNNVNGQLGTGRISNSDVPLAVDMSGALAGKSVKKISNNGDHTLALTRDGQVVSWGWNGYGQLGVGNDWNSRFPLLVEGALTGKTIRAIAAGDRHSLVLTSDGELFAWGKNSNGELGNGDIIESHVPVTVDMSGVLADKVVTAITAGFDHSTVLTSDGSMFAWGDNYSGTLGNGSTTDSNVPVAVDMSGILSGKRVTAISAGFNHILAKTKGGFLVAWGQNTYGQLGDGALSHSTVPVLVSGINPVSTTDLNNIPDDFVLLDNYPNPFNPTTTIRYDLPEVADVSLSIYDINGRVISTMTKVGQPAGTYEVQWNGTIDHSQLVSTGVYLARIQAGRYSQTIKMLCIK